MAQHLETYHCDELLLELLRRRRIDWQDVLVAGGVDPLEAEHREFVKLVIDGGVLAILTEPL